MIALDELQKRFLDGIFIPGAQDGILEYLADERSVPAYARFQIYKNSSFLLLTEALKNTFPVVVDLVGAEFFKYAAHEFISQTPPKTPDLNAYGGKFPAFLDGFAPLQPYPYIGDVARLEWARHDAYLAPITSPIVPSDLSKLSEDDVPELCMRLQPHACLLTSRFPVHALWKARQPEFAGTPLPEMRSGAFFCMVWREALSIVSCELTEAGFFFLSACANGGNFAAASAAALEKDPAFDIRRHLAWCFDQKLFVRE